ncbi:MAG TPA: class I adenylate-forming enzyme family protein [Kofleriaceae bacterium]|nr:class I adenylate-forming enzyme family protein [Kofleriaceae bacterium]
MRGVARSRPRDAAIVVGAPERRLSWAELWSRTRGLVGALDQLPARPCALGWFDDESWLAPTLVACAERGTSLAPLAPSLTRDEVDAIARRLAPTVLATDRTGVPSRSSEVLDVVGTVDGGPPDLPGPDRRAEPGALLLIPSSDLGRFTMLSEQALLATADALAERLGIGEADCILAMSPTRGRHSFAELATVVLPLAKGATIALADPDLCELDMIGGFAAEVGATVAFLTPHQMSGLLLGPAPGWPGSLRRVVAGGAPLSSELWRQFEDRFSVPVHVVYGLAECCACVSTSDPDRRDPHTVGRPLIEVRIDPSKVRGAAASVSDRRQRTLTPPDQRERRGQRAADPPLGEVLVRGPGLMMGYFRNPRLGRSRFTADGFLRTGDVGYMNDAGDLAITGRLSEVIIRDGLRVHGSSIDTVVKGHPEVVDCKSFGMSDPSGSERVHTACVLDGQFSPGRAAEIQTWLAERLRAPFRPDGVTVLGRLPRNGAGAVSLPSLCAIITGTLRDDIYATLTSQGHRRAHPTEPDRVKDAIQAALVEGRPLRFAAFWGAGRRSELLEVDRLALERLRAVTTSAVRAGLDQVELTLVLADVHGRCNGAPPGHMADYFGAVKEHAAGLSTAPLTIRFAVLGEIWAAAGLEEGAPIAARLAAEFDGSPLRDKLVEQAGRRGHADPIAMARRYHANCRTEGAAVAAALPGHLWLTYADPAMAPLQPDLPALHVYSYHQGRSERPWFVDEAPP